jgi:hypothetical protein
MALITIKVALPSGILNLNPDMREHLRNFSCPFIAYSRTYVTGRKRQQSTGLIIKEGD